MVRRKRAAYSLKKFLLILVLLVCGAMLVFRAISGYFGRLAYPRVYQEIVEQYAGAYDLDDNLIYAVMKTESAFRADAVSNQDAKGLMQITEETFDWLSQKMGTTKRYQVNDLFQPEVGILYGSFFLSYLCDEFESYTEVLAAYHAGRGITNQWLQNPEYSSDGRHLKEIPYPKTAHYVKKVLIQYKAYQQRYA